MASKRTQCDKVIEWLWKYGRLTVREAMIELNINSLPRRIKDLREEGHPIKTEWVYKKGVKYGVYKLEEGKHE